MMVPFAKLYKQKLRDDFVQNDTSAWLIGSYVCTAIAINLSNAFKKKGAKAEQYPDHPLFINAFDEQAKQRKKEHEVERSYLNFLAAVQASGMKIEKAAQE